MNKVILMGRLTKDPDIRYTQGENSMAVGRYSVAVDRRRANADGQREADFIPCIAFGKQAEFAEKYLHKGTKIVISGRIQTGSYTNKEGQKIYTTDVAVEEQEFAESKSASEKSTGNANSGQPTNAAVVGEGFEGFMDIPEGVEDEGLPFN